jgi:hypothetical protein
MEALDEFPVFQYNTKFRRSLGCKPKYYSGNNGKQKYIQEKLRQPLAYIWIIDWLYRGHICQAG